VPVPKERVRTMRRGVYT